MPRAFRVLLVHEDPEQRELISLLLAAADPPADAVDAGDALPFADAYRDGNFDAALVAAPLSWAPGLAAVERLRAAYALRPVVLLCRRLDAALASEALRLQVDDLVEEGPVWALRARDALLRLRRRAGHGHSAPAVRSRAEGVERRDDATETDPAPDDVEEAASIGPGAFPAAVRPAVAAPRPAAAPAPTPEIALPGAETARLSPAPDVERRRDELARRALSHDLQEPLRSVRAWAEMLDERLGAALDGESREMLARCREAARRMEDKVARELGPGHPDEPALAESESVLRDLLVDLDSLLRTHEARVTHGTLPRVAVPPSQLRTVLQNLVANAIRYRGTAAPRIHVTCKESRNRWQFSVSDNGTGIPDGAAARIFEPGVRLAPAASSSGQGLGLALCRDIVERNDGRIWVEAGSGGGSVFSFTLPMPPPARVVVHRAPDLVPTEDAMPTVGGRKRRI
jgi:signal transduction histidine kinase